MTILLLLLFVQIYVHSHLEIELWFVALLSAPPHYNKFACIYFTSIHIIITAIRTTGGSYSTRKKRRMIENIYICMFVVAESGGGGIITNRHKQICIYQKCSAAASPCPPWQVDVPTKTHTER